MQDYLKQHDDKQQAKQDGSQPAANRNQEEGHMAGAQTANQFHSVLANQGGGRQPGGAQMLLLLLRLRQCCSHPALLKDVCSPHKFFMEIYHDKCSHWNVLKNRGECCQILSNKIFLQTMMICDIWLESLIHQ